MYSIINTIKQYAKRKGILASKKIVCMSDTNDKLLYKRIHYEAILKCEFCNISVIRHIARNGKKNNRLHNITSCLIVMLTKDKLKNGSVRIIHTIEGHAKEVDQLYENIINDRMIDVITNVDHSYSHERKYAEQPMILHINTESGMDKFNKLHLIQSNDGKNIFCSK